MLEDSTVTLESNTCRDFAEPSNVLDPDSKFGLLCGHLLGDSCRCN